MKSCPTCNRTFEDNLTYCLVDGSILSAPFDPATRGNDAPPTEIMPSKSAPGPTQAAPSPVSPPAPTIPAMFQQAAVPPVSAEESWAPAQREQKPNLLLWIVGGIALLLVIVVAVMVLRSGSPQTTSNNATASNAAASTANMMAAPNNMATPDEGKVHREKGDVF